MQLMYKPERSLSPFVLAPPYSVAAPRVRALTNTLQPMASMLQVVGARCPMLRAASAGALRCALSPRLPPAPAAAYLRRLHLAPCSLSGGACAASTALDYKTVRSRAQLSSCGSCGRQLGRGQRPPLLMLLMHSARQEASRAYIRQEAARLLATMDYCDDSPHNPPREEDPPGAERGLFSFISIVCS